MQTTGCSGLVIACLTVVYEIDGANHTVGGTPVVLVREVTVVYSLDHRLCTIIIVSGSSQLSTLCGMVKRMAAFQLHSNNK